jgi:hypothetical protein
MASDKPFEPTLSDVLVVRAMLAKTTILPELVGTILDYAEYWAKSSVKAQLNQVIAARRTGPGEFDFEEFQFLVSKQANLQTGGDILIYISNGCQRYSFDLTLSA